MFRSFRLKPITAHNGELVFDWDQATGEVRGPGADRVRELAAAAVAAGGVEGDPYPSYFEIDSPLTNAGELAVVLGQFWALDGELRDAYPAPETDEAMVEIGENGEEIPLSFDVQH